MGLIYLIRGMVFIPYKKVPEVFDTSYNYWKIKNPDIVFEALREIMEERGEFGVFLEETLTLKPLSLIVGSDLGFEEQAGAEAFIAEVEVYIGD